MLVAVPVPADGTEMLRASLVGLDRLEILFKAQVDLGGAPGQLLEASARLVDGGAHGQVQLVAEIEDADTGEERELRVTVPLVDAVTAPPTGGPVIKPTEENDLDWEDDDTMEALFKDPLTSENPLPSFSSASKDEEDAGDIDSEGAGFSALLKALMSGGDDATDEQPSEASAEVGAPSPVEPPLPTTVYDPGDARGLLQVLVDREELELEEGYGVDALVGGAAPIVGRSIDPDDKAEMLSSWLFGQDAVAELYIGDDDLAKLLAQW